jgi:hypothetical protein
MGKKYQNAFFFAIGKLEKGDIVISLIPAALCSEKLLRIVIGLV